LSTLDICDYLGQPLLLREHQVLASLELLPILMPFWMQRSVVRGHLSAFFSAAEACFFSAAKVDVEKVKATVATNIVIQIDRIILLPPKYIGAN